MISTFPSRHYDIEDYPAVRDYLLSVGKERLEQTGKEYIIDGKQVKARKKTNNQWFETQDSISYWEDFSKQKIIWGEISDKTKFALDSEGEFSVEATAFLMTGESLPFLLCFLNSRLSEYYFSQIGTTTGVGTVRWKKYKIETFPIPKLNFEEQSPFIELANQVINKGQSKDDEYAIEHLIDELIYQLFGFTEEEKSELATSYRCF